MKKAWLYVRVSILFFMLIICSLAFILQSNAASKYLVNYFIQKLPELSVKNFQGNFYQGITLTELRYHETDLDISLATGEISLNMASLLLAQCVIKEISLENLRISIKSNDEVPGSANILPHLQLPFAIGIQKLLLKNGLLKVDEFELPVNNIQLGAYMTNDHLFLYDSTITNNTIALHFTGDILFSGAWPVNAEFSWKTKLPESISAIVTAQEASGTGKLTGSIEQMHIEENVENPVKISGNIAINTFSEPTNFKLQQKWQKTVLTLGNKPWNVGDGTIELQGSFDNYSFIVNTTAQVDQWPMVTLFGKAKGNESELSFEELTGFYKNNPIDKNESTINLSGVLAWASKLKAANLKATKVNWQLQGSAKQINPELFNKNLPGSLNFNFFTEGFYQEEFSLNVNIDDLSGEFRGSKISGYSHIQWPKPEEINSNTNISISDTRFSVVGKLGSELDMLLKIDSRHIQNLVPEIKGAVSINAKITGSKIKPLLKGNVKAKNLRYGKLSLAQLDITAQIKNTKDIALKLDIAAGQLKTLDQVLLSRFFVKGDGSLISHKLSWQLEHEKEQLTGELKGSGKENGNWNFELQKLFLHGDLSGNWSLQEPAKVKTNVKKMHVKSTPICLDEHKFNSQFCINIDGNLNNALLDITLNHLSLTPFASMINDDSNNSIQIYGKVDAHASVRLINSKPDAQLNVSLDKGHISWLDQGSENYRVNWDEANLQATLKDHQLLSNWLLLFSNNDTISGVLKGEMQKEYPLNGNLDFQLTNLQWLELLLPINQVKGQIHGKVVLTGKMQNPKMLIDATLDSASMNIPEAGIRLENIQLSALSTDEGIIQLQGSLHSGKGALKISGGIDTNIDTNTETSTDTNTIFPWPITINFSGKDVLALDRNDVQMRIDPDLQLTFKDELLKMRGNVTVTEAIFEPRELPKKSVRISRDAERVDIVKAKPTWQMDNDIRVYLGDMVKIDGFGLNARFTGNLRVESKRVESKLDVPLSLTGNIKIEDGRYKAYGQNLKVERGNLYFQGQPDNPGLDILAVRTLSPNNAKVGLDIGGTLLEPHTNVFSDPNIEETEAMALLLTGKPLSSASERDGDAILQAIAVYGINQGEFISERLGKSLGVDVGFNTEGENDKTAFLLGKQLSQKLYITYSVGLFESISSIILRYSLNHDFSLETQTSAQSESIDLLYRKESSE